MAKENPQEHLIVRNVEEVIDRDHLRKALSSGKKLRVKLGIDPTSPDLHLGHAVVLRKLKEFQDLGSVAVLIIGDFTALIGDPSGRDKTRPQLGEKDIKENLKKYLEQAGKIIDIKNAEVRYNSEWLGKLNAAKIIELLGLLSLQQIIEREDFKERIAEHKSVRMHELLYPVFQAYDSVAVKADVELGGTDQTFNLLAGRSLMEKLGMAPQDIMTVPLLEGTDGERKMSKSYGNYIGLSDKADDMFGKVMSVPDKLLHKYFILCTGLEEADIEKLEKELGPRDLKARLGSEIVKLYHGEKAAKAAEENFTRTFSNKEIPADLPALKLANKNLTATDVVAVAGIAKSKGEARRLIEQGALEIDGKVFKDPNLKLELRNGQVIRIGKKSFFRAEMAD